MYGYILSFRATSKTALPDTYYLYTNIYNTRYATLTSPMANDIHLLLMRDAADVSSLSSSARPTLSCNEDLSTTSSSSSYWTNTAYSASSSKFCASEPKKQRSSNKEGMLSSMALRQRELTVPVKLTWLIPP
jgi:hypothetical protein